jgi:hypothetical protein
MEGQGARIPVFRGNDSQADTGMTKLSDKAIALVRACDRKSDVFPACWAFIHQETGGRFTRLSDLIAADMDGDFDAHRNAVLARIVAALEIGDMDLLLGAQSTSTQGYK